MNEVETLVSSYREWLKEKTSLRQLNGQVIEIKTPYLDRHNDYLLIYARRQASGFLLSDDGYVLDDLEQSGCKLDTPKRQQLLKTALNGFGVQQNGRALEVNVAPDNFSLKKHNLVQAMLAVNDLFYVASPVVQGLFHEDVLAWLDLCDIRYTANVKFTGKSGYDHVFDFVIPKSKVQPERVLRTISNPNRDAAQAMAFAWVDTKEVRPANARSFAILNDSDRTIPPSATDALLQYQVTPILWSGREQVRREFQA